MSSSASYPSELLKMNLPQNFMKQIEQQRQQLMNIKAQQSAMSSIDQTFKKKNQEILLLKSSVQKYKPYYEKYCVLKNQFSQKAGKLSQKQKQVQILLKQVQQLLTHNNNLQSKLSFAQDQRVKLIREQHQIQKFNLQIEQTFKLYQEQCKKKERGLLGDLQKAYKQITELNKRIDASEMKVFENEQLKRALQQKDIKQKQQIEMLQSLKQKHQRNLEQQRQIKQEGINNQYMNGAISNTAFQKLTQKIISLESALANRQQQLTKVKILNNELSIEFDKSVNKICEFERELSEYRRQNHELKKTLNLFIEKQQYQKMHLRQLQKNSAHKNMAKSSQMQSQSSSQQKHESSQQEDSQYERNITNAMYSHANVQGSNSNTNNRASNQKSAKMSEKSRFK